jgi:hypothetical protein
MTHTYRVTDWNNTTGEISIRFDEVVTYSYVLYPFFNVTSATDELIKTFAVMTFPQHLLTSTPSPQMELPPNHPPVGISTAVVDITSELAHSSFELTGLHTI